MKLKDKVSIVTGSGSGIGEAIAFRLCEDGSKVVVNDVSERLAEEVAAKITEQGGEAMVAVADVSKRQDVQRMVDDAVNHFGKVDILVNNAGLFRDALLKKMTDEQWDSVLDVDLKGPFLCSQIVSPFMIDQKSGSIINIGSTAYRGNIGQANYSAAKAGLIGLTRTMALELGRNNIRVNCIAPGPIDTALFAKMPEKFKKLAVERTALKRMASPREVGHLVVFLGSDEGSFITGQLINLCGGQSIGIFAPWS